MLYQLSYFRFSTFRVRKCEREIGLEPIQSEILYQFTVPWVINGGETQDSNPRRASRFTLPPLATRNGWSLKK